MKSTPQAILTLCGLTCCLWMQAADAQVAELATGDLPASVTDPIDVQSGWGIESRVTPVGHCTSCDASCDARSTDACDSVCSARCGSCSRCQCCGCREKLTGDWGGYRSCLAESGIVVDSSLTQFYQGVASGGSKRTFRYGDKFDLYMSADTGKLGLWEGGKLSVHAVDWQFGQNSIADAAGLAPVNVLLLTPEIEPSFGLTQLFYEHELAAGWELGVGRVNMLDLWTDFYPDWGRGMDGFMNISLLAPLSIDPSLPLISNAAGLLKAGERGMEAAFLVLESQDSPTTVGLDFPNQVSLLAALRKYTDFGGLPGSHTLVGSYATGKYTSFDTEGWLIDPPNNTIIPADKAGSWAALYLAEQRLWQDRCDKRRYTKMFGYVGFSEPKNSPFEWTGSLSLESFGPLASRPNDRMGIGYFYSALNSDFKNAFSLAASVDDLQGGEVYYNAEITPWFHVTADLQAVEPGVQARDTALVLGLRAKLDF
jgi:porin